MPKPDNTGKSYLGAEDKAEHPTDSASRKPAVITSQAPSTIQKVRNGILTGCCVGFFYALFRSLNISSTPTFWWLVSASAVVLVFAILRARTD